MDREKRKPGHKRKMSTKDALSLFFYKTIYPAAQLCECKSFLRVTQGSDFSHSTISRELRNLALTYKAMRYYSKNRNETDQVAFWTNAPNHPVRTGVAGVHHSYIVDIDETGRYTSAACRCRGHSLSGAPCRDSGPSKRSDSRLTAVIAVDSVKGVISRMLYEKGTTGAKFIVFVQHVLSKGLALVLSLWITLMGTVQLFNSSRQLVTMLSFAPYISLTLEELNGFSTFWISFFKSINHMCATPICVKQWKQHLTVLHHKMWQDIWPKPTSVLRVTPSNLTWVSNVFSIFDKKWLYM